MLLYGGVCVMSGFVCYDTQLIVARYEAGDRDFIHHSLDLFLDFVSLFRKILIILSKKENDKEKQREGEREREKQREAERHIEKHKKKHIEKER